MMAPSKINFKKLIESEDVEGIRRYLETGANRQEIDDGLFWAAMGGSRQAISLLLEYGADVNKVDQFGSSVLHWAVQGSQFWVIDTILRAGADFSKWWTLEGESLLHWASRNNCDFLIETLIELGADYKAVDSSGRMAMHTASLNGNRAALNSLLNLFPEEVDMLDHNGWTPLHYACTSSSGEHQQVIHMLIRSNANPLLPTPGGRTSMDLAFEARRVKTLLEVLSVHDIFQILTRIDDISHSNHDLDSDGRWSVQKPNRQPRRRDQMKTVQREYTFLQENFKRISRRQMGAKKPRKSHEHYQRSMSSNIADVADPKFVKSRDYFSIWRKILLNDDAELLALLRDSQMDCDDCVHCHNIMEECHCLDTQTLIELYYDCFENGLAILSYVRAHFHQEMMSGKFKEILSALTRLDTFDPIDVGGCRVMTPLNGSILFICLLCGRLRVVELLLRMRQFDILPMALLVILIVRRWHQKGDFADQAKNGLEEFANRIEQMALDFLNEVYLKDNSEGKHTILNYINMPIPTYSNMSVVDLAAKACCTKFINHPCCQAVLTNLWLGKLHWLPPIWLWVGWVCPLLLPIYFEREMQKENHFLRSHIKRMDSKQQNPLSDDPDEHMLLFRSFENLHENPAKTYLKIMASVFKSPAYKFFFYSLLYIIFLFMFSYVTIYAFHFQASRYEIFCFVFLIGFAVEELRLLYFSIRSEQMVFYFKNYWNIMSIVALCITFIGFIVRSFRLFSKVEEPISEASDIVLYMSRVILLNGLMIFYLRLLFVFSLRARIGPKIRMISAMLRQDLLPVLFIFVIFFISFGVTFQGILYPNGYDFNDRTNYNGSHGLIKHTEFDSLKNMIRTTFYGMMAAEYNLENRDSHVYVCSFWDKDCVGPVGETLFVYFFMILYVLIVNIMLVNLLIALYSNTVSQIDKESNALWLADRYNLVQEFKRRSIVPPPFSLLCVFYDGIRYLCSIKPGDKRPTRKAAKVARNLDMEKVLINYMITQAFALSRRRYVHCQHSNKERKKKSTRLAELEKSVENFSAQLTTLVEKVETFLAIDKTLFNYRDSCTSAVFMDACDSIAEECD